MYPENPERSENPENQRIQKSKSPWIQKSNNQRIKESKFISIYLYVLHLHPIYITIYLHHN